jgi:hypothetical protein
MESYDTMSKLTKRRKAMANDPDERTVPYQFEVPISLHARVIKKTQRAGVKIAPFMRRVFEELDSRPIDESVAELIDYNRKQEKHRDGR